MRIFFSTSVWGEVYVEKFLRYSLPSWLSQGNLDGFPHLSECCYQIITQKADVKAFEESPSIAWLRERTTVIITVMEDFLKPVDFKKNKYNLMGNCQREGISQAIDAGVYDAISFGYADFIWPTGALQNARKRLEEGYDAVFCPGLPVLEEEFKAKLDEATECWSDDSGVRKLDLPPRQLVKLTIENLHDLAKVNYWSKDRMSNVCAYQMWDVADEGLLMRWFHLHPIFLRLNIESIISLSTWEGSLDEHYIPLAIKEASQIYYCQDSDEVSFCSLMPDFGYENFFVTGSVVPISRWAETNTSYLHRQFMKIPFRFHYAEITNDIWQAAEVKSAAFVEEVLSRLNLPDTTLKFEDPVAYRARLARKEKIMYRGPLYRVLERGWGYIVKLCVSTENRYVKYMVHNRLTSALVQIAKRMLGR